MRKISVILICVILIFLLGFTAFAHRGNTDSNGGHYDRTTGKYHYHHGYPEHQHTNGECPYDFDDKTNHSGGTSTSLKSSTTSSNKVKEEKTGLSIAGRIVMIVVFVYFVFWIFFVIFLNCRDLFSKIKEKWQNRRILSKREFLNRLLTVFQIIVLVVSIIGFVSFFTNPIVTLICGIITVLYSISECTWGEQTNLNTEIFTVIIALIVCFFTKIPIFYGIGFSLCIAEVIFTLIGYIRLWFLLRKK